VTADPTVSLARRALAGDEVAVEALKRTAAAALHALYRAARAARPTVGLEESELAARAVVVAAREIVKAADRGGEAPAIAERVAALVPGDLALVAGFLAGDPGASRILADEVLGEEPPGLLRRLAREVASDPAEVEAVAVAVGDELIAGGLDRYHGTGSLRSWLRAVIRTRRIDRARSPAARERSLDGPGGPGEPAARPEPAALEALATAEARDQLLAVFPDAVRSLPAPERALLEAYHGRGETLEAIALRHGTRHASTILRRLDRAVYPALRAALETLLRLRFGVREPVLDGDVREAVARSTTVPELLGKSSVARPSGEMKRGGDGA